MVKDKEGWSNVIIGPWESKATQKGKTRDQVIQEEMDAIDDLSQTAMVSLIQILKELICKESINIKNFGTFKVLSKNERLGRNPKNKTNYIISSRKTLSFIASKSMNEKMNN